MDVAVAAVQTLGPAKEVGTEPAKGLLLTGPPCTEGVPRMSDSSSRRPKIVGLSRIFVSEFKPDQNSPFDKFSKVDRAAPFPLPLTGAKV